MTVCIQLYNFGFETLRCVLIYTTCGLCRLRGRYEEHKWQEQLDEFESDLELSVDEMDPDQIVHGDTKTKTSKFVKALDKAIDTSKTDARKKEFEET